MALATRRTQRDTERAMSQENVEVIRAGLAAWNAGDMDAFRELLDPDVVVRPVGDWPERGPYVGRQAVMRFFAQARDPWVADTVEATSDFVHTADRVVVRLAWHLVGHGPPMDWEGTMVWSVREGKVCSAEFFWDHDDALEAAGLSG
jgi:ketosteroid isomerase-like protein